MNEYAQTAQRLLSLTSLLLLAAPGAGRAADHADAPAVAQDQGADIADLFTFLDPNDNSKIIIIGTVHGFIVPGEAGNFAAFDENVKYRFEIFNKHPNLPIPVEPSNPTAAQKAQFKRENAAYLAKVSANRTIDVTFSPRRVPDQDLPPGQSSDTAINLAKPGPQNITLTLGGFSGAAKHGLYAKDQSGADLLTTPVTPDSAAPPRSIFTVAFNSDAANDIKVFAGEVDDPFFFDLVAFSRFIKSVHDHAPDGSFLSRGRDTFAGYNVLAIALSVPKSLLLDSSGPVLGVDFVTQRHAVQTVTKDGPKGSGGYKNVDRMGNPAVNVALIPFNKKNVYNASTVKDDAKLTFAPDILESLGELGVAGPGRVALAQIAVLSGDILTLHTDISNTGINKEAAFPNGRRLQDDVIDTILTVVNNGNALGDAVAKGQGAATSLITVFPFLGLPNQPLINGATDDTTN